MKGNIMPWSLIMLIGTPLLLASLFGLLGYISKPNSEEDPFYYRFFKSLTIGMLLTAVFFFFFAH